MKQAFLCGASAAVVTIAALGASQAMAQAAGAGQPPAAGGVTGAPGANVTVIAQRRNQAIERVPVAVTAFTAKQRDLLGIKTTQQLSDFTPGLSYFASDDRAYIRGIGRNTVNLATESGVASYYNGIYYGANATIAEQHDSLFISQIEVDRGPQNTLHGSNADGGTLNYISAKPTDTFFMEGRIGVQNYGEEYAEAVVSGPITDYLRIRLGGEVWNQSGGFYNNLDGKPAGGFLAQANNGQQDYLEAQFSTNIGAHLEGWGIVSSGDYNTSFHNTATVGANDDYEIANATLSPSGFYALCSLPSQAGNIGCNPALGQQPIVPGSVVFDRVNASQFPGNNPANSNAHDFIQDYTDHNRQQDIALATRWTYHFPDVDVTYLGGYQSFYYNLNVGTANDAGVQSYQLFGFPLPVANAVCPGLGIPAAACAAPLTIFPAQNHTHFVENEQYFSNELTLTSTSAGPLQWIAGAYWYHEHYNQPVNVGCLPQQPQGFHPIQIPGLGLPNIANPSGCLFQLNNFMTYDSYAGFGQFTYQINDQWKLEAAARYTDDRKEGTEGFRIITFDDGTFLGAATPAIDITPVAIAQGSFPGTGVPFLNTATGQWERNYSDSWNAVTGEVTLNWQPDANTLAYAKYSRGYKTGGFNAGSIAPDPETQPEYVDSVEVGAKKTVGGVFQINGAAFYYNYQNDQQPLSVQNAASGTLTSLIFNIPTATLYGVELEATWRPIDPLVLTAQYSYLNATVTSMDNKCVENTLDPLGILPGSKHGNCPVSGGVQLVDLVGSHLPETPPNKISLNALYTIPFDPGKLILSASVIWKDAAFGQIFNNPQVSVPSGTTVNIRAEWDDAKNRYNVSAWVNNLFNAENLDYNSAAQAAPAGQPYDILIAKSLQFPLTFGAEFQIRFQ